MSTLEAEMALDEQLHEVEEIQQNNTVGWKLPEVEQFDPLWK